MITFPNCKINLGLHVTRKRPDGFHDIETVFYPVGWKDALEVVATNVVRLEIYGMDIPGNVQENLILGAYLLLKKHHDLPPLHFTLLKAIPIGAGLGGGSADAAFALKLINDFLKLGLSIQKLEAYAAQLGSDCAFFIQNKPVFATGRGEQLEAVELDLSDNFIALVNPGLPVNTGWAYSQITPQIPENNLKKVIQQPINEWKDKLINDFENPVFQEYPELEKLKQHLYQNGAIYSAMSGSGSTVFGVFPALPDRKSLLESLKVNESQLFISRL